MSNYWVCGVSHTNGEREEERQKQKKIIWMKLTYTTDHLYWNERKNNTLYNYTLQPLRGFRKLQYDKDTKYPSTKF